MSCILPIWCIRIRRQHAFIAFTFEIIAFDMFEEIIDTSIVVSALIFLTCLSLHLTTI